MCIFIFTHTRKIDYIVNASNLLPMAPIEPLNRNTWMGAMSVVNVDFDKSRKNSILNGKNEGGIVCYKKFYLQQ